MRVRRPLPVGHHARAALELLEVDGALHLGAADGAVDDDAAGAVVAHEQHREHRAECHVGRAEALHGGNLSKVYFYKAKQYNLPFNELAL